jgi:hypothetical protein
MRRHLAMWVLGGLIGALALAGDAQAFCHKKACYATTCVAPPPPPPPVECAPKKCCFGGLFKRHGLFCHRPKCEPQPCIVQPMPAPCPPVVYAAPVASPQYVAPSMQAPSKQGF